MVVCTVSTDPQYICCMPLKCVIRLANGDNDMFVLKHKFSTCRVLSLDNSILIFMVRKKDETNILLFNIHSKDIPKIITIIIRQGQAESGLRVKAVKRLQLFSRLRAILHAFFPFLFKQSPSNFIGIISLFINSSHTPNGIYVSGLNYFLLSKI